MIVILFLSTVQGSIKYEKYDESNVIIVFLLHTLVQIGPVYMVEIVHRTRLLKPYTDWRWGDQSHTVDEPHMPLRLYAGSVTHITS